jgi:hypothetical protein
VVSFCQSGLGSVGWSRVAVAGKGAKTSYSLPAPVFDIDNDFYVTVDAKGLVTGAGIATLQTVPGALLGNANLIAPRGTVDAGAAGIRVSGNLNIASLYVTNAFNIQVQGVTTGVLTVAAPNTIALTAASNTAGAAADMATQANQTTDQPSRTTGCPVVDHSGSARLWRPQ